MLGKQDMMTIPNHRLMQSKIKSFRFSFTPTYIPGKLHVVPDCMSCRSNTSHITQDIAMLTDGSGVGNESNVGNEYQNTFGPPSWVSQPAPGELDQGAIAFLAPLTLNPTAEDTANSDCHSVENFLLDSIMSALAAIDKDPWNEDALLAPTTAPSTVLKTPGCCCSSLPFLFQTYVTDNSWCARGQEHVASPVATLLPAPSCPGSC